jgi:alpha-glucosidase
LLVAPVIEAGATSRQVILPGSGIWRHCWTGKDFTPGAYEVAAPIGQPALFYRPDSAFAELFAGLNKALAG